VSEERAPWERRPRESSRAYEAFRLYRDIGPMRSVDQLAMSTARPSMIAKWSHTFGWVGRARAWDDHVYRIADGARLDALREMQRTHALAGRVAFGKAVAALQAISPADINASAAVRLLDIGTKLERATLSTSLADLQGVDVTLTIDDEDDPWDVIARELSGTTAPVGNTPPT
jgi:hypothetical protein